MRSVQVHDQPAERAAAGQRVALALVGVERAQVRRGHVVATPGAFPESYRLECDVHVLESAPRGLRNGEPVMVHHGTAELTARVAIPGGGELAPGAGGRVQLRLRSRAVAAAGDHVVIRLTGPAITVAGGTVIDPDPPRVRRAAPKRVAEPAPAPRARAAVDRAAPRSSTPGSRRRRSRHRRSAPATSGRSRTSSPPAAPSAPGATWPSRQRRSRVAQAGGGRAGRRERAASRWPSCATGSASRGSSPRACSRRSMHAASRAGSATSASSAPAARPDRALKHRCLAPMFHRPGSSSSRPDVCCRSRRTKGAGHGNRLVIRPRRHRVDPR